MLATGATGDGGHHPPVVTEGWCSNWVKIYLIHFVFLRAYKIENACTFHRFPAELYTFAYMYT